MFRQMRRFKQQIIDEEYLILEIVEFGGNLYAYGGEAMAEDLDLEAYSFWGMGRCPTTWMPKA